MSTPLRPLFTGIVLSALALAPVAGLSVSVLALSGSAAFANGKGNSGNGNGGANRGNGNSNAASRGNSGNRTGAGTSNGNGNGNGNGNRPAPVQTAPAPTPVVATAPGNSGSQGRGSVASELKWLNAAHANPNAFAHANPDSAVGMIGTYYFAAHETEAALAALTEAGLSPDDAVPGTVYDTDAIAAQIALLDPTSPTYDAAAAEALLTGLGYSGFELLDPTAVDYDAQYYTLLGQLGAQATTDLQNDLLLAGYLDAAAGSDAAFDALMPEGETLSPEAIAELNRLLGLGQTCLAGDPLCTPDAPLILE